MSEAIPNRFAALAPLHVQQLKAYDPGFEPSEVQRELNLAQIIELGSNENSYGPCPAVQDFLRSPTEFAKRDPQFGWHAYRYPDAGGRLLKRALAAQLALKPENITLGNGTHELLTLIAETFCNPNDEIVHAQYGFAVYSLAAKGAGAIPKAVSVDAQFRLDPAALLAAVSSRCKLVYLANPNNPTGSYWTHAQLEAVLAALPAHVIFVLDEAYAEYALAADFPRSLELLQSYPNLVVARTFSKAYGLAGLRVGYVLSHPDFASMLERTRLSFNVNAIALRAATLAVGDQAHIRLIAINNARERERLADSLTALGLGVTPSQGNFLLVDFQRETASIAKALLQQGVVVRPMLPYGLPQHLRFTVGQEWENAGLLTALANVLG